MPTEDKRRYVGEQTKSKRVLVRPYVVGEDLERAYQQMAREEARASQALDSAEATMGDEAEETR